MNEVRPYIRLQGGITSIGGEFKINPRTGTPEYWFIGLVNGTVVEDYGWCIPEEMVWVSGQQGFYQGPIVVAGGDLGVFLPNWFK